mmetsp:Transcript_84532/g.196551  ORF Transcript_84532/g.196551 Transcript_84532/m.196551 type:complete len:200 (-) Transcript_84532:627-1226(-)
MTAKLSWAVISSRSISWLCWACTRPQSPWHSGKLISAKPRSSPCNGRACSLAPLMTLRGESLALTGSTVPSSSMVLAHRRAGLMTNEKTRAAIPGEAPSWKTTSSASSNSNETTRFFCSTVSSRGSSGLSPPLPSFEAVKVVLPSSRLTWISVALVRKYALWCTILTYSALRMPPLPASRSKNVSAALGSRICSFVAGL